MKTPDDAIASPSCDPAPWTFWSLAVEVMRRGGACFYELAISARLRSAFSGLLCILQSLPSCKNTSYCSVCGESQSKKMKHYAAKPIFLCLFSDEIASRAFNTKTPQKFQSGEKEPVIFCSFGNIVIQFCLVLDFASRCEWNNKYLVRPHHLTD